MLYHLKEYGKYAEITGYRNIKFARAEEFLKANRKETQENVDVQFFDAQLNRYTRAPVLRSPKRVASFPKQNKYF